MADRSSGPRSARTRGTRSRRLATAEWEAPIRNDLKGADYEKRLVWKTDEGHRRSALLPRRRPRPTQHPAREPAGAFPFTRGSGRPPSFHTAPHIDEQHAIRADVLHDAGATTVQELAFALAEGVERMADQTSRGISADQAASSISFVFAVGSTFFMEIAKLRAARLAWAKSATRFRRAGSGRGPACAVSADRRREQDAVRPVRQPAARHHRGAVGDRRRLRFADRRAVRLRRAPRRERPAHPAARKATSTRSPTRGAARTTSRR